MRYRVELAHDPDSPAAARRALGDLADHLPRRRLQDAELLVSELVTNAIRHAGLDDGDTITLSVEASDRALRIEVSDPGPGFAPAEHYPDSDHPSGWGLYLVRELSDRWGVERNALTRVWFELDRAA
ncbi:MAG: ATP-binding protein [Solirubrobacteraceae bacterium]